MTDALDRLILDVLLGDARLSHREIARRLESTQPTITARIRRLEDAGVIKGYSVRLDDEAFRPGDQGIRIACHWCRSRTSEPRWTRIGGRDHAFCCPTCQSQFEVKHARLSKDL